MTERSTNQTDETRDASASDPIQGRDLSWFFRHVEQYLTDPAAAHDWNASENSGASAEGASPDVAARHDGTILG